MPGPDLKEPEITDTSPTDSNVGSDERWTDSDTAAAHAADDNWKQQQPQPGQSGGTTTPTDSSAAGGKNSGGSTPSRRQAFANKVRQLNHIRQRGITQAAKDAVMNKVDAATDAAIRRAAPGYGDAAVIAKRALQEAIRKRSIMAGLRELRRQLTLKKGEETAKRWIIFAVIVIIFCLIVLCILVTIIVMMISCIFGSCGGDAYGGVLQKQSTLSLSMDAVPSDKANAGDKITYTIHVKSTAPTTSIVVTDPVPTNTRFYPEDKTNNNIIDQNPCVIPTQDTGGKGFYCDSNKTVTWYLTGSSDASADSPFETSITVTFTVIANNTKIFNVANADSQEASASATTNTDNPYNTNLQVGP